MTGDQCLLCGREPSMIDVRPGLRIGPDCARASAEVVLSAASNAAGAVALVDAIWHVRLPAARSLVARPALSATDARASLDLAMAYAAKGLRGDALIQAADTVLVTRDEDFLAQGARLLLADLGEAAAQELAAALRDRRRQ
jgi:hypothetical protein